MSENTPDLDHDYRVVDIIGLRQALAQEAIALEVHLTYAGFPKSRLANAESLIDRMRSEARGEVLGDDAAGLGSASRAVKELAELRARALAAASSIETYLIFKAFPKSRRPVAEGQIERLRGAALGHPSDTYFRTPKAVLARALDAAGVDEFLSEDSWAAEGIA